MRKKSNVKKTGKTFVEERELTRKELRKEKRQLKKQARLKFFEAKQLKIKGILGNSKSTSIPKKIGNQSNPIAHEKVKEEVPKTKKSEGILKSNLSSKNKHEKLLKKMTLQRKEQLLNANKEEDKEIKFLEKRLKLAKKKSVSKSKGFSESGLDYILDVCDPETISSAANAEVNFEDSDSDFYEDYSLAKNDVEEKLSSVKRKKLTDTVEGNMKKTKLDEMDIEVSKTKQSNKKVNFNSSVSYDSGDEYSLDEELNSNVDEEESLSDVDETMSKTDEEKSEISVLGKPEVWEDIYGRLRDQKGNVIKQSGGKYIPPHLRNTSDTAEERKQKELMRELKGLLNRLALNNMHSISNQIEALYSKNSRHSMNEALLSLYVDSLVSSILSPERLIIDHAMLIAVLHANVGSEIGAWMIQNLVQKFNSLLDVSQDVENKELDNLLFLISYLYNFKVFEAVLMFDILNKLCSQLSEKNVDLILVVLKSVGFPLRKDDPMAMKGFLLTVQKQINQTSEVEDRSRMKYMLEVLLSIKNNNVSKMSDFDPEQHEHLKKVLKSVVRSGNSIVPFRIGLEDLLKAEERGRWWIVGSAWNKDDEKEVHNKKDAVPKEEFSAQLLALAKQQRMNTDNRRNIFCILMSAEDYHDAFEKVLKLGLKNQQEREIPLVIIHCLLQEKNYNPYYGYIADQLCISNRRHQMSLQCALWDRFRALDKLSSSQINNLAKFLAQLLLAGSIPISVLKVVEFTELDKNHTRLLRQTILSIVNVEAKDTMCQVFERVSKSKKLSLFREALRLFIHHFILRNMPDGDIKDRITLVNSILIGDVS